MQRTSSIPAALLLIIFAVPLYSQEALHNFTFNLGAGVTPLVGQISDRLDNGWQVTVGGGYRFVSHFETNVQFSYSGFGVKPIVLTEAAVPSANSHLWSITADPKLRLGGERSFDPYIVGGVGYYRRTIEFTAPSVAQVVLFDPVFGFLFPALIPINQVLGDIRRGGVGGSLGAGFDFKIGHGTRFFTEARYHYASTGSIPTRMVPVTFGFKW
jgi:hypothetical protein